MVAGRDVRRSPAAVRRRDGSIGQANAGSWAIPALAVPLW
jgi:hypothetical protein